MKIGIDLDDTIANSLKLVVKELRKNGSNISMPSEYDLTEAWNLPKEQIVELFKEAWRNRDMMPLMSPNLPDIIRKFKKLGFEIDIITANHLTEKKTIESWLKERGIAYDKFIRVKDPFDKPGKVDVLIEDYGEVAAEQAKKGGIALVLGHSYNSYLANGNVVYCKDWNDIAEFILYSLRKA
ncbi:MAG: hypothetical protein ACP5T4_02575 [Candidatus Micrarchaeia archaeon]